MTIVHGPSRHLSMALHAVAKDVRAEALARVGARVSVRRHFPLNRTSFYARLVLRCLTHPTVTVASP